MADLKQIKLGTVVYDIKDATAREDIVDIQDDIEDIQDDVTTLQTSKADASAITNHKNIFLSTSEPTSAQGSNGDIWLVYEV